MITFQRPHTKMDLEFLQNFCAKAEIKAERSLSDRYVMFRCTPIERDLSLHGTDLIALYINLEDSTEGTASAIWTDEWKIATQGAIMIKNAGDLWMPFTTNILAGGGCRFHFHGNLEAFEDSLTIIHLLV